MLLGQNVTGSIASSVTGLYMPFYTCLLSAGLALGTLSASFLPLPSLLNFDTRPSAHQSETDEMADKGDRSKTTVHLAHRGSGRRDGADCAASVSCIPSS